MATVLGLDITTNSVRGALVRTALRKLEVVQYVSADFVPGGEDEGTYPLQQAVAQVLAQLGKPPDRVVTALDGREASLRVMEIPAGAAKRIGEVLPFELEALLPFPTEEAILDHQPIDQREGQLRILAAAAPRERIAARLAELRDAGVDPKELAVGAAALDGLVQLLPALQQPGPFLLLDLENGETDVCILENGRCAYVRTLSSGLEDVESGRLERELRATITSWRAAGAVEPIECLVMGGASIQEETAPWIGSKLGIDARVVPLPPVAGAQAGVGLFGRATALACRTVSRTKRIDLRQGEFAPKRAMGALRQHTRLLAIGAAAVFLSFAFATWARWSLVDDENEALRAELGRVTEQAFNEETTSPTRVEELLAGGSGAQDPLPRFDAYSVVDALSGLIPPEITHDTRRLSVQLEEDGRSGRFELQGTVASVAERDQIAQAVESHECFQDIEKGRTTPGPGNQGLNYQIEVVIQCPDVGGAAPQEED